MSGICSQLWIVLKLRQGGIFWAAIFSPCPLLYKLVCNSFEEGGALYFRPLFMCLSLTQFL